MTRLHRYVLSMFLRPLLFSYGALTILVLMAEMMERLDKFIAGKATVGVVAQYLLAVWPLRSQELLPVSALLAALFALGQLSRRMEITAALSGGIHPWQLTAPLLVTGVVLSFFSWGVGEAVNPWASRQAKALWNADVRHLTSFRPTKFEDVTVAGKGVFYSIGLLDTDHQTLRDVVVDVTHGDRPRIQWQARSGVWTDRGWKLIDGFERRFSPDGRALERQTAFATRWIDRREKATDLVPQEPDTEEMNRHDLRQHIDRLKILGIPTQKLQVELHMKTAFPWANFIVLLIGVPFSFNKRGGKVRAVALALAVAFGYFGLMQVGHALGQKDWCPPFLGAWLANLIFLTVGLRFYWRMKSLD
ncbi:MAG TPA: LptF/LptG family permease [Elusimicrobiota bacterium]|nr:LptF/LptG family permease [Elusimicrobiota bacterium]